MNKKIYAGFWSRLGAAILDALIVLVPMPVVGIVVALITGPRSWATAATDIGTLLAIWLYFTAMESSSRQATLGKIAFGIHVTDVNGERLTFARASGRFFAKLFSALPLLLGFLMAAIMPRKRALHDLIAGSVVVNSDAVAAPEIRTPSARGSARIPPRPA